MRTIKIGEGQVLIDVAMQYCGDSLQLFAIAELNGYSITDFIFPGTEIIIPDLLIENTNVFAAFNDNGLFPASMDQDLDGNFLDGIDYWVIEEDFIVQ